MIKHFDYFALIHQIDERDKFQAKRELEGCVQGDRTDSPSDDR